MLITLCFIILWVNNQNCKVRLQTPSVCVFGQLTL